MDMPWLHELMREVHKLNEIAKDGTRPPDERVMRAAVKLGEQIKSWDPQTRELIDALDKQVSENIGDFLIEIDKAIKKRGVA